MCYRKKELKNRVLEKHKSGFDKYKIKAPCGNCPSCRRVRANDWLVRSYFEFLGNHSQAYFVSLDFDNEHLPTYKGMPCFDSEIMKLFLKRLRNNIGKFRYLYVSEYGGLLKRPHYHIIVLPFEKIGEADFHVAIIKSWKQGSHTRIDCIQSVHNDKIKAIQYVVGYTTKDISWNPDDDHNDIPPRFRPRTQASKGFGLRALEEGLITPDDLLNRKMVTLPIGKNGRDLGFPIPRYYEMKLAYDYHWDKVARKAELIKNEFGVKLCKVVHNGDYVYTLRKFFSSRNLDLHNQEFYHETVFSGLTWRTVVYNCFDDSHDFSEFVYYRPFISFLGRDFIVDNIRNESLYRPSWSYYDAAFQVFERFYKVLGETQCKLEADDLLKKARQRAIFKIYTKPGLMNYLKRKNYDFSQLYV